MSSIRLDIIDPISCQRWNELVMATEDYSIFHTANWARILHETYGFVPNYFSLMEGGRLAALIPVMEVRSFLTGCKGVSLPFSDFCEPMLPHDFGAGELTKCIASHGRTAGWKYLELRGGKGQAAGTPSYSHYYTHTLDLSCGEVRLFNELRDSTRRNIAKAAREKLSIRRGTSREFVDEFYRLNCMTRKQHGMPPQPYRFFEKLHEHLIAQGMGTVFLAKHDGACIAGAVFLHCGTKVLYKFGASERKCQHLRANNFVMWEAIRSFSREGYGQFSFGRTEPENEGLRQFKNGWGGEERIINYYRYDIREERFMPDNGGGISRYAAFVSKLPLPLLKTIGKYLYRHVG